jgi:hypothetical protein
MMTQRRGELGLADPRRFHLIDYRHGHSHVVIRGIPGFDEEGDGGSALRVIDFFFVGVSRISCWKDFTQFNIRFPGGNEAPILDERIGKPRHGEKLFLLEAFTLENYILASRVYWAEFDLGGGALSPLASDDQDYKSAHPPIDGVVLFAD